MTAMFMAVVPETTYFKTYATTAYSFGTGDFTLVAMPRTSTTGSVMSYSSTGSDGFKVSVDTGGAVHFTAWIGGTATVVSTNTGAVPIDGSCHCIGVVRQSGSLSIFVDCIAVPLTSGGTSTSLPGDISVTSAASLEMASEDHGDSFSGSLMNVGVWTRALTGDALSQASFAVLEPLSDDLAGYWTLNQTTADSSPLQNALQIVGTITYMQCFDCVWVHGDNCFRFIQIQSTPYVPPDENETVHSAVTTVMAESRPLHVPSGAPALVASLVGALDGSLLPPSSAHLSLTDPDGVVYDNEQNTDTVFVNIENGSPTAIMVISPKVGEWRLNVTCDSSQAVYAQAQVVASSDVVSTTTDALTPLFDPQQGAGIECAVASLGGFWSIVGKVAVAAVAGVAGAAVVIASGGTALPAVAAGLVVFSGVTTVEAAASLPTMGPSYQDTCIQVGGLAGFVIANANLLLIDANVAADPATQIIYTNREKYLYPAVDASGFKTKQSKLIGTDDKRTKVAAAMSGLGDGFVSASGHGRPNYLMGWYVSGNSGALQEVLTKGGYSPSEVQGKIIHIFGCHCGNATGLGPDVVTHGAVAFFGYNVAFQIITKYGKWFCLPDIEIDKALIIGKTCEEAYHLSIGVYDANIKKLDDNGDPHAAATLEADRDALVSPSTNSIYGDRTASLSAGT